MLGHQRSRFGDPGGRRAVLAGAVTISVLASLLGTPTPVAATSPALVVSAPRSVAVGEPIVLRLSLRDARNVGGYEAALLFDTASARFDGFDRRGNGLEGAGRGAATLGPVMLPQGEAFGLYTCPVADCASVEGVRTQDGPSGTIPLGAISVLPDKAGLLQLDLAGIEVVDTAGRAINVTPPQGLLVEVVGGGQAISAPAAPYSIAGRSTAAKPGNLDLTADGRVTETDASEVELAWSLARFRGDPCDAQVGAGDVTGDGCVDVGDLVSVAAGYSAVPAPAAAPHQARALAAPLAPVSAPLAALAFTKTFVVTSNGDAPDAAIDGFCATAAAVCTLRAAIQEANASPGEDLVNFNIPGTGVQTIAIATALTVSDGSGGVTVDGYSQPGATPNTDPLASNAVLRIAITGPGDTVEYQGSTSLRRTTRSADCPCTSSGGRSGWPARTRATTPSPATSSAPIRPAPSPRPPLRRRPRTAAS